MIKEYFLMAIKSLRTRPLRSWLTIIGIVMGVFLIISLYSLSEGIKQTMLKQLRMIGGDLVMVMPGELSDVVTTFAGGLTLSNDDIAAIKKADGVEYVVQNRFRAELVRYDGEQKTSFIYGIPLDTGLDVVREHMGWELTDGRWPQENRREVIVGSLVPDEIFPDMRLNTDITIRGKKFTVVGVLRSLGSKQDDQMIMMGLDLYEQLTGDRDGAPMAIVTIEDGADPDVVAENIKEELEETRKRVRGEDLPPFSVITSEKAVGIVGNVMQVVQASVFMFASIGILVGGIGIMNTMYMSVSERTREIGVMKAIGAKTSHITGIFLIESGIIGLIGGIGGTLLGLILAKIIEMYGQVHPVLYIEASVSPWIVLFGLSFSFAVGCLSGWLPARRAAKLKPVEALRYE